MRNNKAISQKIGMLIFLIVYWCLSLLFISLVNFNHMLLPIFIILGGVIIIDMVIGHIMAKKNPDAMYFNPEYRWKYKMLPWMCVCLITLAVYWKETLLILDLIAKKLG